MIAAATIPYYGYSLKMFPFAGLMPGKMHLRICEIGPFNALFHIPSFWRGSYRNPKRAFDFLVDNVQVELENPYPFQHSGDSQGPREHVNFSLSEHTLELVNLHPSRRMA